MPRPRHCRRTVATLAALVLCLAWVPAARAYVDGSPEKYTLPRLVLEFRSAGLFEVERVDLTKGAVRFKPVESIQGAPPPDGITHVILYDNKVPPELKDLQVGQRAVLFRDDPWGRAVTMIEGVWYVSKWDRTTGTGRLLKIANPFFECGFVGTVPELMAACTALLRGEEVTVRCRAQPKDTDTQWMTTSLREPHKRMVVPTPKDAATGGQAAGATPTLGGPAVGLTRLPALLERLKAEKPQDRMEAAKAIGQLGPGAAPAAGALAAAFPQEKDPFARRAMVTALGAIGPEAREAVPALLMAVRHGTAGVDDLVGFEAAEALAKIDPDCQAVVPVVVEMLKDKRHDVRCRAAAMGSVLPGNVKALAPVMLSALRDESPAVRQDALRSLHRARPDAATALPVLTELLGDKDKYVRACVANALADYGAEAAPAVKAITAALAAEQDPNAQGRMIGALRSIGPAAAEAIPVLEEFRKNASKGVQWQVDQAIAQFKKPPPPKPAQ